VRTSIKTDAQPLSLIDTATHESIDLLKRNLSPHGVMAATATAAAEARRYTRIFGRDAGICTFGMLVADDAELRTAALAGLELLARHQADNGQIPKYVDPIHGEADFWYVGCIDATLWWLMAVDFAARECPETGLREKYAEPIAKALTWLRCQEHPRLHLLQQNEASDWADIMPRSGFVLYTNALWYHVKQRFELPGAEHTRFHFNHLFYPFAHEIAGYQRLKLLTDYIRSGANDNQLYLSFVNFAFWGDEGDVFGNLLAVLLGLSDDLMTQRILNRLQEANAHAPYPSRAVLHPIAQDSPLWRIYMQRHEQNYAHQYHNGGVWPFIGGFAVMALAGAGREAQAREALSQLAQANSLNDWEFNEWLHGETGEPRGMVGQSWNAAMFLLARAALNRKIF